jgi:hypothetical protein
MNNVLEAGGCIAIPVAVDADHTEMDAWCKANGKTATFAPWHPNPEYRIFTTGSLLSRNEQYPSGVVIVDRNEPPRPWKHAKESTTRTC